MSFPHPAPSAEAVAAAYFTVLRRAVREEGAKRAPTLDEVMWLLSADQQCGWCRHSVAKRVSALHRVHGVTPHR